MADKKIPKGIEGRVKTSGAQEVKALYKQAGTMKKSTVTRGGDLRSGRTGQR